jgi:hypothetical protein
LFCFAINGGHFIALPSHIFLNAQRLGMTEPEGTSRPLAL